MGPGHAGLRRLAQYNDFYCARLTELLTRYGPLREVWFDGAVEVGPVGTAPVRLFA